jgi:uncharacterized protein
MTIPRDHPNRSFPAPASSWSVFMRWHELLFMHWPLPPSCLRPLIPRALHLDSFDGAAWIGVVPFRMSATRHRLLPPIPGTSAFPELNVRTYVTLGGKPGVWFFSLDAASRLAVRGARWLFHLPYYDAQMSCGIDADEGEWVDYASNRTHRSAPPAKYVARYRPRGPVFQSSPGTLEHFLTERYCLYSANRRGKVFRGDIAHRPWPLQLAEAKVKRNRMLQPLGIELPEVRPLLHYAHRLDVIAWALSPVD